MIEVGQAIEDITLPGNDGEPITLSEVLSVSRAAVIVFYLFDFSGG